MQAKIRQVSVSPESRFPFSRYAGFLYSGFMVYFAPEYSINTPQSAANSFIRSLLSEISDSLGHWTDDDEEETNKFFKGRDPYTGEPLGEKTEWDHIIPQNKDECGLNVYGNLVQTNSKTNSKKSSKDYKTFIDEDKKATPTEKQERIDQIDEFREISGYKKIHDDYFDQIKEFTQKKYDEIVNMVIESAKELAKKLKVDYVPPSRTKSDISEQESKFWEWASKKVQKSTIACYRPDLRRILKDADKSFDDFASDIETIKEYQPGGKKAALGGRYGQRVLKMLLEYMTERSVTEKKGIISLIKNKLNGIRTFVLGIVRQKRV